MPTVPFDSRRSPDMPVPSETDLWMALATMRDLGRIPKSDFATRAEFSGATPSENIEDRRKEDDPYVRMLAGNQRIGQAIDRVPYAPGPKGSRRPAGQLAKDAGIYDIGRASIGVSGGSR